MAGDDNRPSVTAAGHTFRLRPYVDIARIDHWFKNVFVVPGLVVGAWVAPPLPLSELTFNILLGLASICLIVSSNYTLNEVLDAATDRHHPTKHTRPVATGQISIPLAYTQWLVLMIAGLALGLAVSVPFAATMALLWFMGCVYNIPPVRAKDIAYVDVLTESVNNPLRLVAGWFMVGAPAVPPGSLLMCYWMAGAYFMAVKRLAELRGIGDAEVAARYRKSFATYTNESLIVSIMFYASASMLFLGVFIMRYRLELVLAFPMIALLMALYLRIGFRLDSRAQRPEELYREREFIGVALITMLVLLLCLAVDMPWLSRLVAPLYGVD